ncbi:MAG: 5'-nucleotidase C-terminal domain-containing protein [Muribaculaceae bacterium]|nr:5'-nucleotidase C-terminal domain-containing protein [Muribaculaceae bacterium]
MNVGGIRNPIPQGPVTAGHILSSFPFSNRFVVLRLKGKDIIETLQVAAKKGGEAVSHEVTVVCDSARNVERVLIDLKEVDPEKTYTVATINYVAWGNDDMRSMANGEWIFADDVEVCAPYIRYVNYLDSLGIPLSADTRPRFLYNDK